MFYFHNFIFKVKEVGVQNMQTGHQGNLRMKRYLK